MARQAFPRKGEPGLAMAQSRDDECRSPRSRSTRRSRRRQSRPGLPIHGKHFVRSEFTAFLPQQLNDIDRLTVELPSQIAHEFPLSFPEQSNSIRIQRSLGLNRGDNLAAIGDVDRLAIVTHAANDFARVILQFAHAYGCHGMLLPMWPHWWLHCECNIAISLLDPF